MARLDQDEDMDDLFGNDNDAQEQGEPMERCALSAQLLYCLTLFVQYCLGAHVRPRCHVR
jgi:hypothetical protein